MSQQNKYTLETYEKIAEKYANVNAVNDTIENQRIRFQNYLKQGVVFDLGCGTGRDAAAFNEMGLDAFGFDASHSMLSIAKKNHPASPFLELNLLESELNLPFQADGIWCCASLLHFEQQDFISVFHRILDSLKTNGIFYFSLKIKDSVSSETVDGRFFQYYTKRWLDDFLHSFGNLELLYYEENVNGSDLFSSYFLRKNIT